MASDAGADARGAPNVVFLMSDQHRGDAMSCAGHPVVRTPALDGIAAQGCRFTRAYTTSPLCMPARASLAIGRYNHNHGMVTNRECAVGARERRRALGLALQRAGYRTAFVGKHHLLPQRGGFDMRRAAGFVRREFGFDHLVQVLGKFGSMRADCDWTVDLRELGLLELHRNDYQERKRQPVYFARPSPLPRDEQCDSFTGRKAIEWIESGPGQPFFLWVSFPGPHDPWDAPGEFGRMYDPAEMPPPLAWDDRLEGKPASQRERWSRSGLLEGNAAEVRRMAAQYYGLVSNIDDWCGRIVSALEGAGMLANTVVVYTSDHGEMLGDHRLVNKSVFYEGAARVPLLLADYREAPAGAVCPALAETIDVYRTVLGLAGAAVPEGTFGDDLGRRGLSLGGADFQSADCKAECNSAPLGLYPPGRGPEGDSPHSGTVPEGGEDDAAFSELDTACMVRAGRWKYVHDAAAGGPQELYDLEDDPQELRNRVADPEYRAAADELRSRIVDWLTATQACDLDEWDELERQF